MGTERPVGGHDDRFASDEVIRLNGSGNSWWSQRRWSRMAGLARTATGTMGSPAWRATMSTPGLATRYGPHGPSGVTTTE